MCLQPLYIKNPTKFISPLYSQRVFLSVGCGECAECQNMRKNEYYYRTYYEYLDTIGSNGYMLFDCLTYANRFLPYISDFLGSSDVDFPCFSYDHLRSFRVSLRRKLDYLGYDVKGNLSVFIAAEYGTSEGCTHRPHYHILLFVKNNFIEPLELSRIISEVWKYGRTDGVSVRGARYVLERCTLRGCLSSSLRVCNYVAKYVVKDSSFTKVLNSRISAYLHSIYDAENQRYSHGTSSLDGYNLNVLRDDDETYQSWLHTSKVRDLKRKLKSLVSQHSWHSSHYGESALNDLDLNDLFENGTLLVPSYTAVKMRIPIPIYYKRKIMYEQVKYRGAKYWQLNDIGIKYREHRKHKVLQNYVEKLASMAETIGVHLEDMQLQDLALYSIQQRGKFRGDSDDSNISLEQIADTPEDRLIFNYSHSSDVKRFGKSFQSKHYIGCSQNGYSSAVTIFVTNLDGSEYKTYLGDKIEMLSPTFLYDNSFHDISKDNLLNQIVTKYNSYMNKQEFQDRYMYLENLYKAVFA